jgi:hypothetical protein
MNLITFKIGTNRDGQDILVNINVDRGGNITSCNYAGMILDSKELENLQKELPKIDSKMLDDMKKYPYIDLSINQYKNDSVDDIVNKIKKGV